MKRKSIIRLMFVSIALFLFLSLINIKDQYSFNGDSARDTLQSLRILKNREITFVGPPLSLGQNGQKETYFSSAIYYIGALGLLVGGNNPIAPVILVALLNASGIIPLILILKKRNYISRDIILITFLYVTNPIVINYSRIFWNPSPLIGLSLWGAYAFTRSPVLFGIVGGIVLYFHYFGGLLFVVGAALYGKDKKCTALLKATGACVVSLVPFLYFELRNKFYLTQSFLYNVQHAPAQEFVAEKLNILLTLPAVMLGLSNDYFGTRLIDFAQYSPILGIMLWVGFLKAQNKTWKSLFLYSAVILTVIVSKDNARLQYLFIGFGGLLAYCIPKLNKRSAHIVVFIILLQLINTVFSITHSAHIFGGRPFPTIPQLEKIHSLIVDLHKPGKRFNVTENVTGDARAAYVRFFFEKTQTPLSFDLQNEFTYENLDELYVVTPSLQKTLKEQRWELTATKNLTLKKSETVGSFILLQYARTQPAAQ